MRQSWYGKTVGYRDYMTTTENYSAGEKLDLFIIENTK